MRGGVEAEEEESWESESWENRGDGDKELREEDERRQDGPGESVE